MNDYMKIAVAEALRGMQHNEGGPFGAIVVCNGEIISCACNQVLLTNDPTAHAEIQAIRIAAQKLKRFDLSDCRMYATCEPCPMCLGAVFWARIPRLYYGCSRQDAAESGFSDKTIYDAIIRQSPDLGGLEILQTHREDCLSLMQYWQNKTDKIQY